MTLLTTEYDDIRRKLWCDAFLLSLDANATVGDAASVANYSLDAFDARCERDSQERLAAWRTAADDLRAARSETNAEAKQ